MHQENARWAGRLRRAVAISASIGTIASLAACGDSDKTSNDDEYPTKSIEVIVPFDAGGFTDSTGRVIVEALKGKIGKPISVTNKAGAGGVTATAEYKRARPDGYSIMALISGPTTEALAADPKLPYSWDSFTILGGVALSPRVFVAPAKGKFETAEEMISALKNDPKSVSWATGSPQGPATFSTLALFDQLDVDAKQPRRATFNGDGPAVNAVAGGHVDFAAVNVSTALPLLKAGKLKSLVVSGTEPLEALPGVPIASDLGLDEFVLDNWFGFMAPPDTPKAVVDAWASALEATSKDPKLAKQLADMGSIIKFMSAAELSEMVEKRYETSKSLVEKFGTD